MTTCPPLPPFQCWRQTHREDHHQSSGMSSVYDCVISSLEYTTLKWGEGSGRIPGHDCAWHMEQDMQKVGATLKRWRSNCQRKIRFPDYLSRGWTRKSWVFDDESITLIKLRAATGDDAEEACFSNQIKFQTGSFASDFYISLLGPH